MHKLNTNTTIFLIFSDLALTLLALFIAIQARFWLPYGVQLAWDEVAQPWAIYLLVALIWGTTFVVTNVYNVHRSMRAWDEAQAITFAIAVACLVFAGVLYLTYREVPRRLFFYFVLADVTLIIGFRFALRGALRFAGRPEPDTGRVLIVGTGHLAQRVAEGVRARSNVGLVLVGLVGDDLPDNAAAEVNGPVIGTIADTPALVKEYGVTEVVFALPLRAQGAIESLVLALQEQPVSVRVVPDFIDLAMSRATIEDFNGLPLVGLRDPAIDGFDRVVKRVFDLVLSSLTLLVFWPVLLLVALAIKLDSPGPALFIQERIGENGRPFRMVKFRSMVLDADDVSQPDNQASPYRKSPDDPRVTRVGQFIRRTSLDELPQLFNVLRGDMSLVGPRPELPRLVEHYENWQRRRFAVPPGITGWWQVNGRSDRMMHQHTEDDLYYIQNYSPLLDVQILWRTIGVVVKGRGAY